MITRLIALLAIAVAGALCAAAAFANVSERHIALEFSDYRVSLLRGDFKNAKACQAFIAAQRRDSELNGRITSGGRYYGCADGGRIVEIVSSIFGKKAAEVLR